MSQEEKNTVTLAALKCWSDSNSKKSFMDFVIDSKNAGNFWGADETLEDAPAL